MPRFVSVDSTSNEENKSPIKDFEPGQWNLKNVRDEVNRKILRTMKKISNANEKLSKMEKSITGTDKSSSFQIQEEILLLKSKLDSFRKLDDSLRVTKSASSKEFADIIPTLRLLEISGNATAPQERGPTKVKAKPSAPRLPYFKYISEAGIEIRVGRGAEDNDELSCNPLHRDGSNWWLHVAGFSGSHVVIRSSDDNILTNFKETVIDAALLAAVNSKANQSGRVAVTLTRCQYVTKPHGAKAGLVQIRGDINTINIDMRTDLKRLDRLQKQP
eukprot:CAMPEP_0170078370 /NCGR_PEP_ID=MMETSP0019_2-20121128/14973_1 /TAXON_ID=98059 /ORGANISM="Dinobryon sp., Strain UTEXLB2267" /LENGTH=273 /DNA_ID=CAMNT_0010291203 /DNA_START=109 /DNA_END=930 /DNA_ORIENTATION=-